MKKIKAKYLILFPVVLVMLMIIFNLSSQPGVQDLKGDFEQVAMYRNENNTGPIVRVYAVTVYDTLWAEMEQYSNFMPHTKYGNTKVYFFAKGSPVPKNLSPGQENFEARYNKYCLATYEKDAMGVVSFRKNR